MSGDIILLGLLGIGAYLYFKNQSAQKSSMGKEIGQGIGDIVTGISDKIKDGASQIGTDISNTVQDVKDKIDKAAEDVKSAFDKGVGRIPDKQCPTGKVMSGGLCYSLPDPNWYVSAPGFIAKKCPPGWRDDGTTCWLDAETYGRGTGYPWKFGDALNLDAARARCENDNGRGNCEQYGQMYYPKCRPGFAPSGCCTCLRNTQTQSKSVTAQVGTVPIPVCNANETLEAGLCYKK
jgi:hypothetical protein